MEYSCITCILAFAKIKTLSKSNKSEYCKQYMLAFATYWLANAYAGNVTQLKIDKTTKTPLCNVSNLYAIRLCNVHSPYL